MLDVQGHDNNSIVVWMLLT